jgi:Interleukin-like EMT inducer
MPSVPQTCSAGEVLCLGTIPQTCGADGKWVTGPPCPFACRGGCVNKFTAASAGRGAPTNGEGVAEFTRNGTTFYSERGGLFGARGFNVAVLDPATGAMLEPVKTFDPWTSPLSGNAFKDLAAYLEAIEPGRLVLIATCDDAGLAEANSCDKVKGGQAKKAVAAIERLGSKEIGNYCYRGAWSFIALTGRGALAEKLSTGAKITAEAFLPAAP